MSDVETVVAPDQGLGTGSGPESADPVGVIYLDKHGKVDRALLETVMETAVLKCKRHPRMRGLRRPRNRCERCMAIYEYTQRTGVRETRRGRRKNREANA
jgi:hypothetical protein